MFLVVFSLFPFTGMAGWPGERILNCDCGKVCLGEAWWQFVGLGHVVGGGGLQGGLRQVGEGQKCPRVFKPTSTGLNRASNPRSSSPGLKPSFAEPGRGGEVRVVDKTQDETPWLPFSKQEVTLVALVAHLNHFVYCLFLFFSSNWKGNSFDFAALDM